MPAVRRRLRGPERRALILKAATRLFAERHYRSTTLGQIAAEAGVSEALICKHFTTKKQLFLATIEATGRYLTDGLEALTQPTDKAPLEMLREAFLFYFDYLNQDRGIARMIFQVSSELDDKEVRQALARILRRASSIIRRALELGQDRGIVRTDIDLDAVTWLIVGCYQVLALMKEVDGENAWKESTLTGFITPVLEPRAVQDLAALTRPDAGAAARPRGGRGLSDPPKESR
jgi:AcrR family transcriptional regulator